MLNNLVKLSGEIVSDFNVSHSYKNETFLIFDLKVKKEDNHFDIIKILTNKKIIDDIDLHKNDIIYIEGEFHSYNDNENNKNKLLLFCFAKKIFILSENEYINHIFINGYICKELQIRNIKDKLICDILVAVNRKYKKSDYIPCVILNDKIENIKFKKIGDQISFEGKIQSRKYIKKYNETTFENKVAYEVLIEKIIL